MMRNTLDISKVEKGILSFKDSVEELSFKFMEIVPEIDYKIELLLVT